jgi:hypothetical protein
VLKASALARPVGQYPEMIGNGTGAWLWLADVAPATRPGWIEQHTAWLTSSELARLHRIVRPERRAQLLAGHVLLRHLVAARTGLDARAVQVTTLADGRPEVTAPAGWQPSLAHSKQWVAALLDGGGLASGVDIEWMHPGRQIETIVKMACGVDAISREHAYQLWTQREAGIKAASGVAAIHVTTWHDHALAVCAGAKPAVTLIVDLDASAPPRGLELTWTTRPRLSTLVLASSRERD